MDWSMVGSVVGIVAALNGGMVWAVKWLLDRHADTQSRRLEDIDLANRRRLEAIESTNASRSEEVRALQTKVLELRAELPEKYVRREDWIRFSSVIDAKLDALRAVIESVKEKVYEQRTDRP